MLKASRLPNAMRSATDVSARVLRLALNWQGPQAESRRGQRREKGSFSEEETHFRFRQKNQDTTFDGWNMGMGWNSEGSTRYRRCLLTGMKNMKVID